MVLSPYTLIPELCCFSPKIGHWSVVKGKSCLNIGRALPEVILLQSFQVKKPKVICPGPTSWYEGMDFKHNEQFYPFGHLFNLHRKYARWIFSNSLCNDPQRWFLWLTHIWLSYVCFLWFSIYTINQNYEFTYQVNIPIL